MYASTLLTVSALSALASAHFNLDYPAARRVGEDNEDALVNFPCGGADTPSTNRTLWPLSGGQIALEMGHLDANVEVLIGFGNDVGSGAFNTILCPTFQETGLGAFCMTGFSIPSDLNITEGTNATIQVQTNGDPDGGLYNCADITFSDSAPGAGTGVCTNVSGLTTATSTVSSPNLTSSSTTSSSSAATSTGAAAAVARAGVGGFVLAAGAAFALVL